VIEVEHLSYAYPLTAHPVLYDVSFSVPAGQFCAVIGPNSAGKSTLCYALSGFIPHFYHGTQQGRVTVAGLEVPITPLAGLAGTVGLVFQNPFNQITGARFTVRGEVAFGLENLGVPRDEMLRRSEDALRLVGLERFAERSPYELSGGQQQRLAIASVIIMRPSVLILDEPTSQLDPVGTREVFAALGDLARSGETTVILVEHKLEWIASFADRVIALAGGQIIADGAPRDVLTAPGVAAQAVGQTRYTRAARLAVERGLAYAASPLPVTLGQSVDFFSAARPSTSHDKQESRVESDDRS
jgi:energy-coupling factor transporter ATP-binding protein EcfA2